MSKGKAKDNRKRKIAYFLVAINFAIVGSLFLSYELLSSNLEDDLSNSENASEIGDSGAVLGAGNSLSSLRLSSAQRTETEVFIQEIDRRISVQVAGEPMQGLKSLEELVEFDLANFDIDPTRQLLINKIGKLEVIYLSRDAGKYTIESSLEEEAIIATNLELTSLRKGETREGYYYISFLEEAEKPKDESMPRKNFTLHFRSFSGDEASTLGQGFADAKPYISGIDGENVFIETVELDQCWSFDALSDALTEVECRQIQQLINGKGEYIVVDKARELPATETEDTKEVEKEFYQAIYHKEDYPEGSAIYESSPDEELKLIGYFSENRQLLVSEGGDLQILRLDPAGRELLNRRRVNLPSGDEYTLMGQSELEERYVYFDLPKVGRNFYQSRVYSFDFVSEEFELKHMEQCPFSSTICRYTYLGAI
ncbi:MAG: hypothetical protein ACOCXP_03495, partial [Candidatus Dojkabacteria bacterium]